jgi:hypothetical protein
LALSWTRPGEPTAERYLDERAAHRHGCRCAGRPSRVPRALLCSPSIGVPLVPPPAEGWLWERSWGRQTLWWGMLVLAIVAAVVAVAVVPPDTTAATVLRAALLAVAAWGAVRQSGAIVRGASGLPVRRASRSSRVGVGRGPGDLAQAVAGARARRPAWPGMDRRGRRWPELHCLGGEPARLRRDQPSG